MIIAFDFDGTVCVHQYPLIGEELPGAIKTLKYLQENGHDLFLWTMRGHLKEINPNSPYAELAAIDTLQHALDWLEARGLKNIPCKSPAQFSTSLKQYATVYIDDAALGCPKTTYSSGLVGLDWRFAAVNLCKMGLLNKEQLRDILNEIDDETKSIRKDDLYLNRNSYC